jgi:hypothetical protein
MPKKNYWGFTSRLDRRLPRNAARKTAIATACNGGGVTPPENKIAIWKMAADADIVTRFVGGVQCRNT